MLLAPIYFDNKISDQLKVLKQQGYVRVFIKNKIIDIDKVINEPINQIDIVIDRFLIKNDEPRCRLVEVANRPNIDRNGYSVSISFYVVNSPNPVQVETFLERLR